MSVFMRFVDLLLPPLCLVCEKPVGGDQSLCPQCWNAIHFISSPCCARCGAPFDFTVEEGTLCGDCLESLPVFTYARSAMVYNEASKRLILGFKHGDRLHPAPTLAVWMQNAGAAFWEEVDIIAPVPLHWWRLFSRRYNQAALLAAEIEKRVNKKAGFDVLRRVRRTVAQGHMNKEQRRKNVAGAFQVRARWLARVKGKNIALIDDVLTTGATVNECSRVLLQAGAKNVYVVTLARTRGVGN